VTEIKGHYDPTSEGMLPCGSDKKIWYSVDTSIYSQFAKMNALKSKIFLHGVGCKSVARALAKKNGFDEQISIYEVKELREASTNDCAM